MGETNNIIELLIEKMENGTKRYFKRKITRNLVGKKLL